MKTTSSSLSRSALSLVLSLALLGVSSAVPPEATEPGRKFIETELVGRDRIFGDLVWTLVEAHDLTPQAKKAVHGLPENEEFQRYLETKNVRLDQSNRVQMVRVMSEYLRNSTNTTPEIAAWFRLTADLRAPWHDAIGSYQVVAKRRANDILPKLLMLARPLMTRADADQWLALLKETYAAADTSKERALCLLGIPRRGFELAGIGDTGKQFAEMSKWLDESEKAAALDSPRAARDIGIAKYFVAFARKDFDRAAEIANGPGLHGLRPLALIMAGKIDEARKAAGELQNEPDLSDPEKKELDATGAILEKLP